VTTTWYVTFQLSKTVPRRRCPRSTKTFETEAEAKACALIKFDEGLVTSAGTINPHLPKQAIAWSNIHLWLEVEKKRWNRRSTDSHRCPIVWFRAPMVTGYGGELTANASSSPPNICRLPLTRLLSRSFAYVESMPTMETGKTPQSRCHRHEQNRFECSYLVTGALRDS
jgi:hypothetical protein